MEWSVVLPVKDELEYFRLSFPSCVRLHPNEIVLLFDYEKQDDLRIMEMEEIASKLCRESRIALNVVYAKHNPKWMFHQAFIRRLGYLTASYDKIFTFDVDTIITSEILKGYDLVERDNVTFVTFRKKLAVQGFTQTLRSVLYDVRRKVPQRKFLSTNKIRQPFIGIYWLWRPYYLDLIREEVVSKIYNGEDTLAQMLVESHPFYKHIHRDDLVGCVSLRGENEDTKWRQEQLGIYLGCCSRLNTAFFAKCFNFFRVFLQIATKVYPNVLRGFFMGRNYPPILAKKIYNYSYTEMIMYSKYNNGRWHYDFP